MTRRSQTLNFI